MTMRAVPVAVLGLLVMSVSLWGTAGIDSMEATRPLQVEVVSDDIAYLGFEQQVAEAADGRTNVTVEVRNQFPPGTVLTTVEVTVGERTTTAGSGSLQPGSSVSVAFESVPCGAPITVEVYGPGVEYRIYRTVSCP